MRHFGEKGTHKKSMRVLDMIRTDEDARDLTQHLMPFAIMRPACLDLLLQLVQHEHDLAGARALS